MVLVFFFFGLCSPDFPGLPRGLSTCESMTVVMQVFLCVPCRSYPVLDRLKSLVRLFIGHQFQMWSLPQLVFVLMLTLLVRKGLGYAQPPYRHRFLRHRDSMLFFLAGQCWQWWMHSCTHCVCHSIYKCAECPNPLIIFYIRLWLILTNAFARYMTRVPIIVVQTTSTAISYLNKC